MDDYQQQLREEKKQLRKKLEEKENLLRNKLEEKEKELKEKEEELKEELKAEKRNEGLIELLFKQIKSRNKKIDSLNRQIEKLMGVGEGNISNTLNQGNNNNDNNNQGKTLLKDGLPSLVPLGDLLSSSFSVPQNHQVCKLRQSELFLNPLQDLKDPQASPLWAKVKLLGCLNFSSESDVATFVVDTLTELIGVISLNWPSSTSLSIRQEASSKGVRADSWIIDNVFLLPVGSTEVKRPQKINQQFSPLDNPRILGESFDQLMRLQNFAGMKAAFGIITSYKEWRIVWLDDEESKRLAKKPVFQSKEPATPLNQKTNSNTERTSPPTPARQLSDIHPITTGDDQNAAKNDNNNNDENADNNDGDIVKRILLGTKIYSWDDKGLISVLISVILKMQVAELSRVPLQHPFERMKERTLLVFTKGENGTTYWKPAPNLSKKNVKWDLVPRNDCKNLFAVCDLGSGARARCWICCTASGHVCVMKFYLYTKNAKETAMEEKKVWDRLYPEFKSKVRVAKWGGRWVLTMPHLSQSVKRDEKALKAIEMTLRERFVKRNVMHNDIAWRNIGFYKSSEETKAIVFDFDDVGTFAEDEEELWVKNQIKKLKNRVEVEVETGKCVKEPYDIVSVVKNLQFTDTDENVSKLILLKEEDGEGI